MDMVKMSNDSGRQMCKFKTDYKNVCSVCTDEIAEGLSSYDLEERRFVVNNDPYQLNLNTSKARHEYWSTKKHFTLGQSFKVNENYCKHRKTKESDGLRSEIDFAITGIRLKHMILQDDYL